MHQSKKNVDNFLLFIKKRLKNRIQILTRKQQYDWSRVLATRSRVTYVKKAPVESFFRSCPHLYFFESFANARSACYFLYLIRTMIGFAALVYFSTCYILFTIFFFFLWNGKEWFSLHRKKSISDIALNGSKPWTLRRGRI